MRSNHVKPIIEAICRIIVSFGIMVFLVNAAIYFYGSRRESLHNEDECWDHCTNLVKDGDGDLRTCMDYCIYDLYSPQR